MAQILAPGTGSLRQDQKSHERCIQPWDSPSDIFQQSDPLGSAKRQTEKDPRGIECDRSATVVRGARPQRTDPRTLGRRDRVENERTVRVEVEGCLTSIPMKSAWFDPS